LRQSHLWLKEQDQYRPCRYQSSGKPHYYSKISLKVKIITIMQTHQIKRTHENTKRMIVARGGKRGKTSGRGGKGQTARAGNKRRPEWRDIIKQLPKLRGRGINQHKSIQTKPAIVNVGLLEEMFSAGDKVNPTILVEKFIIKTFSGNTPAVKILGDGELTKKLVITGCSVSESAKVKIEKVGGSIVGTLKDEAAKVAKIAIAANRAQSEKAKSANAGAAQKKADSVKAPKAPKADKSAAKTDATKAPKKEGAPKSK
jgi:large subunit ribosomal protein L15